MRPDAQMNSSKAKGLTLIEVLIALLVISIGLLGVAGLQAYSLRNNYDALMRSHASALAADIADRMRANRDLALQGDYNLRLTDARPVVTGTPTISARDLNQWRTSIDETLPGENATGEVDVSQVTRIARITIEWGERDQPELSFVTETEI